MMATLPFPWAHDLDSREPRRHVREASGLARTRGLAQTLPNQSETAPPGTGRLNLLSELLLWLPRRGGDDVVRGDSRATAASSPSAREAAREKGDVHKPARAR